MGRRGNGRNGNGHTILYHVGLGLVGSGGVGWRSLWFGLGGLGEVAKLCWKAGQLMAVERQGDSADFIHVAWLQVALLQVALVKPLIG